MLTDICVTSGEGIMSSMFDRHCQAQFFDFMRVLRVMIDDILARVICSLYFLASNPPHVFAFRIEAWSPLLDSLMLAENAADAHCTKCNAQSRDDYPDAVDKCKIEPQIQIFWTTVRAACRQT